MPRSEILRAIFDWWIGETVGVLTVAPFLLIFVMPNLKRFVEGQPVRRPERMSFPRPTLSAIGQAASIILTLYWVFGAPFLDEFRPMYLLSLPLIWIALQRGFKGVCAAILAVNSGVVLALWLFRFDLARLGELELLMIVNCIVGLLMGAVVTERKKAEEEILKLNAKLEQRVEERTRDLHDTQEQLVRQEKLAVLGQLAGSVSHELRNPLSVINTSIYYLKLAQPKADEKIKEHHSMIEQEVHNADKIIGDLLDFAREISAEREPVYVAKLVNQTLERFHVPTSIGVVLDLPDDLPDVFADPRQVEQILGNLVVNACQAMGTDGKLTISAKEKMEIVAIAVKDTGMGITPEDLNKLFEPLFSTKAKGIGLGLAVSRKLAEANSRRIEVESEPGKGSTFTLYIPVSSQ